MPKLVCLPAHPAVAQVTWESAVREMGRKLAAHGELIALQGRDLKTASRGWGCAVLSLILRRCHSPRA